MKTSFKIFLLCLPFLIFLACQEEEISLYNKEEGGLRFGFSNILNSVTRYTFVYEPQSKLEDTVWIEVLTIGFLADYPREVALCQLESDAPQAEPNVHYVPFDDPQVASSYVVPAGANSALLPVIVKRHASLSEAEYTLTIGIVENEHFKWGFPHTVTKRVAISDILTKPANWSMIVDMLFTPYGSVKHRFMIDAAAPIGVIINEDFITTMFTTLDTALMAYWIQFFRAKLVEENARRAAQGLGPLQEDPSPGQSEGTLIVFTSAFL
jgi:hypothetical protein